MLADGLPCVNGNLIVARQSHVSLHTFEWARKGRIQSAGERRNYWHIGAALFVPYCNVLTLPEGVHCI